MAVVSHYNVQPVIDIFGAVDGRDLGGVARDITPIVNQSRKNLPRGSQVRIRGQIQTMNSSFVGLLAGLGFSIVLVYLLIVVNFQSWLDPFIILMALPAALAGIVWFLFITHTTISVPALTGAIMCMGVATSNSILLISFSKEKLQAGKTPVEAALDAGFTRFRPVLMTALAMIIGMLPMSLGLGEGGEQNAPLGPRCDRWPPVCHRGHAFFRPGRLRYRARLARERYLVGGLGVKRMLTENRLMTLTLNMKRKA